MCGQDEKEFWSWPKIIGLGIFCFVLNYLNTNNMRFKDLVNMVKNERAPDVQSGQKAKDFP